MQGIYKSKYFLMLSGVLCGVLNGLLGAGGGIVAVWAIGKSLDEQLEDGRDLFANALCVMLPVSAVSILGYSLRGNLSTAGIGLYILPAILGGALGGALLGRLKLGALRRLFSALVVVSGILLLIR